VLIRDGIPGLEGVAYLNAGTNGPLPSAAADAMRARAAVEERGPRSGMPYFQEFLALRDRVRGSLAEVLGTSPDRVALTSSTTQGIGLVMAGIDWATGDEVVTTTEEHPGITSPLDVLARRFGVAVHAVDADEVLDAIAPTTKMVALSHVLWTTGKVLDMAVVSARAHEVGALVLADGAQGPGNIAVDPAALGVDFYACSGQKWLLGPNGSGALWVSAEALDRVWPATSGYLSLEGGEVGHFKPTTARLDAGTIDPVTLAGLNASLEWVASLPGGRAAWTQRAHAQAAAVRAALAEIPGVTVGETGGAESCLVACSVDGIACEDVAAGLAERGVLVRFIPHTPWMRVSVGAWTSDDDVERLIDGVRAAA